MASTLSSQKQALRSRLKQAVAALPPVQRRREAAALFYSLLRCEAFARARTVMLYASLPDEADTHSWPASLQELGKRVVLPVVVGDGLELREYVDDASLRPGAYHILEPQGPAFTDLSAVDLVVVPGVGFDAAGHRLGRGRGYYDRFLSQPALSHAYKVGCAFSCQVVAEVPVEPHDFAVHALLDPHLVPADEPASLPPFYAGLLLPLPVHADARGSLVAVATQAVPPVGHAVDRVFWITGVPHGQSRGFHAHRSCHEVLFCLRGSLTVHLDDGRHPAVAYRLSSPAEGLRIPPMYWCELTDFSADALCLCLASGAYDHDGYIETYDSFLATVRAGR